MPDTGLVLGLEANDLADGDSAWANLANALADDANSTSSTFDSNGNTNALQILNFPWEFAEDPVGIEVQIRARASSNSVATLETVRVDNSGTPVAGGGGSQALTTENQTFTWGGPTDMWNFGAGGLTNAEATADTFGVRITGGFSTVSPVTIHIEAVWMKIYYNVSGSGTASITLPGLNMSAEGKIIGTADITLPGFQMKAHHRID